MSHVKYEVRIEGKAQTKIISYYYFGKYFFRISVAVAASKTEKEKEKNHFKLLIFDFKKINEQIQLREFADNARLTRTRSILSSGCVRL